jgi:hypothetical protein
VKRGGGAIDLNLLAVLDMTLGERSVRRAAARLGITPSAERREHQPGDDACLALEGEGWEEFHAKG